MHRANLTTYRLVRGQAKFELKAIYLTLQSIFCLTYSPGVSFSSFSSSMFIEISLLENKPEGESTRDQAGPVTKDACLLLAHSLQHRCLVQSIMSLFLIHIFFPFLLICEINYTAIAN